MTTPLQLTANGLQTQTWDEIFAELGLLLQARFGNTLNTDVSSINGQYMRIVSELRAVDQQALLDVYRSFDPNSAVGTALAARCALTGTVRHGESYSTVEGELEFNAAGIVPNGTALQNDDTSTQWQTIDGPYTDTGGPYPETVAARWQAVEAGSATAPAGTAWSLVTPLAFLNGAANPSEDATLGALEETDAELRYRRTVELYSQGQGPLASIASVVSRVDTENGRVDTVRVYHNPNINPVDADGIPFKAFNVVLEVTPTPPSIGLQRDIFAAILSVLGAGGEAYGTDYTGTAVDYEGQHQIVAFDLVALVDVFLQIEISTSADELLVPLDPAQMATEIQSTVTAAAQDVAKYNKIGRDVREVDYVGAIVAAVVAGELGGIDVIDVSLSTTSKTGPYIADVVPLGIRERPDIDSGKVRVVIDGTVYIA